jgi:hypothetical protein
MRSEFVLLLLLCPFLSFSQPAPPENYTSFSHTIDSLHTQAVNFVPEGRTILGGKFSGYAVYYGLKGSYSTDIIPVTASITNKDRAFFEMQWRERKGKPSLLKFYAVASMLKFDTSAQYIHHRTTDGILRFPMTARPGVHKELDIRFVNDNIYLIGTLGDPSEGPLGVILSRIMEKNRKDIPDTVSMGLSQTWVFDFANIDITLKQTTSIQLALYSPKGKLLKQTSLCKLPAGNFASGFNLIGMPGGEYTIRANAIGDQTTTTILKFHKD